MEKVRNRTKIEFIKKHDNEIIIKQQSKPNFTGFHKSTTNSDSYIKRQTGVLVDKLIYLGFAIIELCKLDMCKT